MSSQWFRWYSNGEGRSNLKVWLFKIFNNWCKEATRNWQCCTSRSNSNVHLPSPSCTEMRGRPLHVSRSRRWWSLQVAHLFPRPIEHSLRRRTLLSHATFSWGVPLPTSEDDFQNRDVPPQQYLLCLCSLPFRIGLYFYFAPTSVRPFESSIETILEMESNFNNWGSSSQCHFYVSWP